MAKTENEQEREAAVMKDILAALRAMPEGHKLTPEEMLSIFGRMPQMPDGWTSADYIRELRGPLPEDDPEYQRFHARR